MSNFVHLHVHSHDSVQDGVVTQEQLAKRASELSMPALALTDHGRCSGLLAHKKACKKYNIKPIFGSEFYVSPKEHTFKEQIDGFKPAYHLTVLAKNEVGLRNLFKLSSISWLEGFYYRPRISLPLLKKHKEGLIVLSGCSSSYLANLLLAEENKSSEIFSYIEWFKTNFKDDYYLEVQNHGLDFQKPLKDALFWLSEETKIPIIVAQDVHYLNKEDADFHGKIVSLSAGNLTFEKDELYFKSREQMEEMFNPPEYNALDRTLEVADKCNVEWNYGKTIWPVFPLDKPAVEQLKEQTYRGLERFVPNAPQEYIDRLEYELDVIIKLDFSTYFLVVADFMNWAKNNNILTARGRGSAAGSLICYCLGITGLDPIKYKLFFERFLNPDRISNPDIDSDVDKERRHEVIEYLINKYSKTYMSQIGTYSFFKPKGALRDFARVCGYPQAVGNSLAKLVPPDVAGKTIKFEEALKLVPELANSPYPEVVKYAQQAEGIKRHFGVHAAGVIIGDKEIDNIIPLCLGKDNEVVSQFDMKEVEELGLVKLDILGLKTLTVISDTLKLIKQNHDIKIDIDAIDEEDQRVYQNIFWAGKLKGIFQFELSAGLRELTIKAQPNCIKDLSALIALFRPGPLSGGDADKYVARKNGEPFEYIIPELEPILSDTYGILIYQESAMRLCTDLALYTASEADIMRNVIGKKMPEKMAEQRIKFCSGCVKNNINEDVAHKIFDLIEGFGLYGFNLSHSLSYSIIGYQTAWLKYYYPQEFYTALLNSSFKDQDDLVKYIYSARQNGIPIEPPNVNRSDLKFKIDNDTIIFGLGGIKGLGEKGCQQIIDKRPGGGYTSLEQMVKLNIGSGLIKALAQADALSEITDLSPIQLLSNLDDLIRYYQKMIKYNERINKINEREKEIEEAIKDGRKLPRRLPKPKEEPNYPEIQNGSITRREKLKLERESLGFYLTGHPLDLVNARSFSCKSISDIIDEGRDKSYVNILGVVSSVVPKRIRKSNQLMGTIILEDKTAKIEGIIFPKQWKELSQKLIEDTIVIANGRLEIDTFNEDAPITKFMVERITNIPFIDEITSIIINLEKGVNITYLLPQDIEQDNIGRAQVIAQHFHVC